MSTLTFTLIQSHLHWENKQANLEQFEEKIKAIEGKKEVVVLPEMFSTGFSLHPSTLAEDMNGNTLQWMKRIANEHKIIVAGSAIIKEANKYYNRLVWMQPNGDYGYYDKRHLFSYGGEDKEFSHGEKRLISQVKGWKICTQICYDLRFPVWTRMNTQNEYDVLLLVANWPSSRIQAWKTLLQARAIENQCYVIGVNRVGEDGNGLQYNGNSCVINPLGEFLYLKEGVEDTFTIELDKQMLDDIRTQFPFQKDKDGFILV